MLPEGKQSPLCGAVQSGVYDLVAWLVAQVLYTHEDCIAAFDCIFGDADMESDLMVRDAFLVRAPRCCCLVLAVVLYMGHCTFAEVVLSSVL